MDISELSSRALILKRLRRTDKTIFRVYFAVMKRENVLNCSKVYLKTVFLVGPHFCRLDSTRP